MGMSYVNSLNAAFFNAHFQFLQFFKIVFMGQVFGMFRPFFPGIISDICSNFSSIFINIEYGLVWFLQVLFSPNKNFQVQVMWKFQNEASFLVHSHF